MMKFIKRIWYKFFPKKVVPFVKRKRPPAKKIELTCDGCGKKFLAYPSEYPQLAFAANNDGVRPLIYCNGTKFDCFSTKLGYAIPVDKKVLKDN